MDSIWTMSAPGRDEKTLGKHPTQKPVALVERCLIASTHPGDLVLDPFLGGGTTAVACVRLRRNFVGVELNLAHLTLASKRTDAEIITLWLREMRVRIGISVITTNDILPSETSPSPGGEGRGEGGIKFQQKDLDLFSNLIDRSAPMADKPEPATERIFHETKFVFLSCAVVSSASVVHTTVDISLQEAWTNAPTGKKRETTHIVRCETEIFRVKSG
jgi:DNA methylase